MRRFGKIMTEGEQEPNGLEPVQEVQVPVQEPLVQAQENDLMLQLLDVLQVGLSSNDSKYEEVKQALIALIEIDGMTGKYTGKVGAFLEEVRVTVKSRNTDLERSVQVINELNPNKMYGQMREALQAEQQEGWDKMKADQAGFHKILADIFDELQAKRKQDIAATNQNVNKILTMQEGVDKSLGQIYNKIDKGITGQNADMQETKATVQTAMYDMGALFAQSMKEAAHFKKLSQNLFGIVVFVVVAFGVVGVLLISMYSSDAALARQEAELQGRVVKSQIKEIDSLETIIKGRQYRRK